MQLCSAKQTLISLLLLLLGGAHNIVALVLHISAALSLICIPHAMLVNFIIWIFVHAIVPFSCIMWS